MIKKILFLVAFNILAVPFMLQANANDMINNSATGVVTGNITQIAEDGTTNIINVGSIIGKASNTKVSAVVKGDIYVHTKGNKSTTINIGSVGR